MAGILSGGGLPPGLQGYVAGTELGDRRTASQLNTIGGILQAVRLKQQMAAEEELKPLELEKARMALAQMQQNQAIRGGILTGMGAGPAPGPAGASGGVLAPQGGIPGPSVGGPAGPIGAGGPTGSTLPPMVQLGLLSGDPGLKAWAESQAKWHEPRVISEGGALATPAGVLMTRPKIGEGMRPTGYGPTGELTGVEAIPGFAGASAAIKGAEAGATEGARAGLDIVDIPDGKGGTIKMTRAQAVQALGGGQSKQVPPGWQYPNLNPAASDVQDRSPLELAAMNAVSGAQGPSTVTIPGTPAPAAGGQFGRSQTAEERSASETTGRETAQLVSSYRQKMPAINATLNRLNRLEALNADDKTFAAGGAEIKTELGRIAQGFGIDVAPFKTATSELYLAQIGELMKDRLASKDYGSGSGVSNLDLIAARQPLPELAKTRAGRAEIINAIRLDTQQSQRDMSAAVQHFDRNLSLRDFEFPSANAPKAPTIPEFANEAAAAAAGLKPGTRVKINGRTGTWQ